MKALPLLLLVVLVAGCATATPRSEGLKLSYSVLLGAHQLDILSTRQFRAAGRREGNNLLRRCVDSLPCLLGVKGGAAFGTIALVDTIIRPKSDEAAKAVMWVNISIIGAAVLTNYLNMPPQR